MAIVLVWITSMTGEMCKSTIGCGRLDPGLEGPGRSMFSKIETRLLTPSPLLACSCGHVRSPLHAIIPYEPQRDSINSTGKALDVYR